MKLVKAVISIRYFTDAQEKTGTCAKFLQSPKEEGKVWS